MDPKIVRLLLLSIHLAFIFQHAKAYPFVQVWIVQNEGLKPIELTSYQDLNSNNVYIVHNQEQDARRRSPEIYCWIGASSSPEDAVQAVITTLTTDLLPTNRITRGIKGEFQRRESHDFMKIIPQTEFTQNQHPKYEDRPLAEDFREEVDGSEAWLTKTRMILVTLYDTYESNRLNVTTLEEVEFSSKHLQNDAACLIAFNPKKVYLHCGKKVFYEFGIEYPLTGAARFIANKIMQESPTADLLQTVTDYVKQYSYYLDEKNSFLEKFKRSRNKLRQKAKIPTKTDRLKEEFDEISDAKMHRRNIEGQFSEMRPKAPIMNLSITSIEKNGRNELVEQDFTKFFVLFLSFIRFNCYIIDPGTEPFNMLVWMGEEIESDVRKKCIGDANIIARERGLITYIDEKHTALKTQSFRFNPRGFIQFMDSIYESWTDIFHSSLEDPGYGKF